MLLWLLSLLQAFEWKTQQHLALVMDRLALHKSRLESESLRRCAAPAIDMFTVFTEPVLLAM